jgi:hypothetical protein
MMAYRGPHVSVTQQFQTNPPGVAVESLAPALIGTAFNVFSKEKLGEGIGIVGVELPWMSNGVPVSDVIYSRQVIGRRAFDFYAAKAFVNTPFGYVEMNEQKILDTGAGVEVLVDDSYTIPGTVKAVGESQAFIPMFIATGTNVAKIYESQKDVVNIVGGSVVTNKIQVGQKVVIGSTLVGVVGSLGADETKVKLAAPYDGVYTLGVYQGNSIEIGTGIMDTAAGNPINLFDPTADFVSAKIKPGDLVSLSSNSLLGTQPFVGSVKAILNKNTIEFNVKSEAYAFANLLEYKKINVTPGATVPVSSYEIKRLIGFSQDYGLRTLDTNAGVPIDVTGPTAFEINQTTLGFSVPLLSVGDKVAFGSTNSNEDWSKMGEVATALVVGAVQKYTLKEAGVKQDGAPFVDTNYIQARNVKVRHSVVSDFRAINGSEAGVAKRITTTDDVVNFFGSIVPENELAFMCAINLGASGGKVLYAVNVNAASGSLSAEYADALEALKMIECYTHAFGTTDGGVNGLMSGYVDEQSDPYEAHERTGILAYSQDDVYKMGESGGSIAAGGLITAVNDFNLVTGGVQKGDQVEVIDNESKLLATYTVTATPTVANAVQTNGTTTAGANLFRFVSGRKEDQAVRISNLAVGNRRVSVIWPGWFQAQYGTVTKDFPPYFISAAIAGMDSGVKVSQSFTNREFAIAGLSNLSLNTSSNFRKAQLDVIGGGGIDLLIQDGAISQLIRSRHDLTSNMDAIEYRERSITKQADTAAKTIRSSLNPYIGKYNITPDLISFLRNVVSIASTQLVKDGVVASIEITKVQQDPLVVDKINIDCTVTVFVAGNYYDVTLTIKSR